MKKNFFAFYLIVISITGLAQDIDEDFLNTLPEDVRNNVIESNQGKIDTEKPIYRKASTFVDKDIIDKRLFGSNFFDVAQSSFMPTNEPNLDSSYILDYGDVLEVQLIGQINTIEEYSLARDGSINIPKIGQVFLSGLSLENAISLIQGKVNNAFIGTDAFISLKNVRDINILITGNAYNPGVYTINGNANMLHALSMAGGVGQNGSYREIQLIRNGVVIDNLDLYDMLIFGEYNFNTGLRSGDIILVKPILKTVAIESGVLRKAIYEIKENESFDDLLSFANGFSNNANRDEILIKRTFNGTNLVINANQNDIKSFDFFNNDSIFIKEYKINNIVIEGAVKNPGNYKVSLGTTLSEMIETAGGFESTAYPFGGYLENKKALEVNTNAKDKLYEVFLNNLILNGISPSDVNIQPLLQQLKNSPATGRIIAEFDTAILRDDKSKDTILEDGDKIIIPYKTQQIFIHGEISNPGAIRYAPGKTIDYYIDKSGGVLKSADRKNIFIIHPNGETENIKNDTRLSFVLDNNKQLIYPGSIIFIPRKTRISTSLDVASIWAPIISNFALSITSLSVLNKN